MSELFCGVSLLRFFIGQNYTKHIECIENNICNIGYFVNKTSYFGLNKDINQVLARSKTVDTGSNPVSPAILNIYTSILMCFFMPLSTKKISILISIRLLL